MPSPSPLPTTQAAAKAEHQRLGAELARHDLAYHRDDAPLIADADYDELRRRYVALEAAFPALQSATSQSDKVGAPRQTARGFVKDR